MGLALAYDRANRVRAHSSQLCCFKHGEHLHLGPALRAPGRPPRVATGIDNGAVALKNDFGSPSGFHQINVEISVNISLLYNWPTDHQSVMSSDVFGAAETTFIPQ